ncbi:MAG: helix-turn-helix transcriptional regulator [bacterium]|nr:helix-turn-helix transcriptional regulator [bacterium]
MKEIRTMGSRIREQRKKMGMTQEELAAKLLTKKGTISAYENDRIDMKCSVVKEIAKALKCSTLYLLEGENIESQGDEFIQIFCSIKNGGIRQVAIDQLKVLTKLET